MLDPASTPRGIWARTTGVLLVWTIWVSALGVLGLPKFLMISALPLVLLFGVRCWNWLEAVVLLLVVSWIYAQVSLIPPGLLWVSLAVSFVLVRFASIHILIRSPWQFAAAVAAVSFLIDSTQAIFIKEILETSIWNWTLLGRLISLAFFHAMMGFMVYIPLESWVPKL